MSAVYDELRAIAQRYLRRERPGHTLQATALVHECLLKLSHSSEGDWENRRHFIRAAARAIRQTLVDHAISRKRIKRGGQWSRTHLDDQTLCTPEPDPLVVAVDEALDRLAELDPRKAQVVELRFFGGLGTDEVGEVLGVSARTVERDWRLARAWLRKELGRQVDAG